MNTRNPQRDESNLDAPEKFQNALQQLHSQHLMVPPEVDAAVMKAAHRHLRQADSGAPQVAYAQRHSRPTSTLWAELRAGLSPWLGVRRLAMVTTVIVAGALVWLQVHSRSSGLVEDLNRDGVVDMLDAFALARQLEPGQAPRPQLDFNGDGRVDERDVQALAAQAVSLEAGGNS